MKRSTLLKMLCVGGVSALLALSLVACNGSKSSDEEKQVAATVNGTTIYEDEVTKQIESIRTSMGAEDEDTWGETLAMYGYTPEDLRKEVIDSLVQRELILAAAEDQGMLPSDEEVDEYLNEFKANYATDEAWQEALESAGMTEDKYREEIVLQMGYSNLQESFVSEEDPTDEELMEYVEMYASAYDGARKSSHILFTAEDSETAQKVLDQINAGELDFAEAAKEYSTDTGSAADGGNVGWDCMNSFVTEYTDALAELKKDEVSGLVTSDYGIHIIKCTDVYEAPEEVKSVNDVPAEWLDSIIETVKSQKQSENFSNWLEEQKEKADIVINDMPEGLSYDVDMSKYESAAEDGSDVEAAEGDVEVVEVDENGEEIEADDAEIEADDAEVEVEAEAEETDEASQTK